MEVTLTKEMFFAAIKSLDEPAKIPTLFYGGYYGLPLALFPDIPDGGKLGSFYHVKTKRLGFRNS